MSRIERRCPRAAFDYVPARWLVLAHITLATAHLPFVRRRDGRVRMYKFRHLPSWAVMSGLFPWVLCYTTVVGKEGGRQDDKRKESEARAGSQSRHLVFLLTPLLYCIRYRYLRVFPLVSSFLPARAAW